MTKFADQSLDVRAMLNASCSDIEEQLAIARSFEDRIRIAERFLLRRIPHYPGPDPVAVAVQQISASKGAVRIDQQLAGHSPAVFVARVKSQPAATTTLS